MDIPERNHPKKLRRIHLRQRPLALASYTMRNREYRSKQNWWQLIRPSLHLEIARTASSFGYDLDPHQEEELLTAVRPTAPAVFR
jgi:hypothetical protein